MALTIAVKLRDKWVRGAAFSIAAIEASALGLFDVEALLRCRLGPRR